MAVGTLVDTNVLLDILTEDDEWYEWSSRSLADAAESGPLFINPIVYAELSTHFTRIEHLDEAVPPIDYRRGRISWDAAFLAGRAHLQYRRRGGTRRSTLPDFFIGAHAAVDGLCLLTRDASRYRTYFPTVQLISPDP